MPTSSMEDNAVNQGVAPLVHLQGLLAGGQDRAAANVSVLEVDIEVARSVQQLHLFPTSVR